MFRIFNLTLSLPFLSLQRHLNSSLPSNIFHSQCLNSHSCSELEYVVDLVKYKGPFKKASKTTNPTMSLSAVSLCWFTAIHSSSSLTVCTDLMLL